MSEFNDSSYDGNDVSDNVDYSGYDDVSDGWSDDMEMNDDGMEMNDDYDDIGDGDIEDVEELDNDFDYVDESDLSPSELAALGEAEFEEARAEAEQWADEQGMDTWSDGTPRYSRDVSSDTDDSGSDDVEEFAESSEDLPDDMAMEDSNEEDSSDMEAERLKEEEEMREEAEQEAREKAEYEALEAEVNAENDELLKEYEKLASRRDAILEGEENADNVDDAYRFADDANRIGEMMEDIKSRYASNLNRLRK